MIERLDRRRAFGGFNHNKTRYILQGFIYDIINKIGGERGGKRMEDKEL